ncbi:hypothetical protein [Agathobacter sp.]|uniref:hypothetical protein n=1 Tax=Agathobacter sp. TaxID=2021311 RepID=UPI003AB30298
MKVKDIIERNKTVLLYDFVNRELEKALNRAKELNEKMAALPDKSSEEGLKILVETEHLAGKIEGINLVMEELERLA